MNLDRFAQGLPDPQEKIPVGYCGGCGGEIYSGEEVYVVGYDMCHANEVCLALTVGAHRATAE